MGMLHSSLVAGPRFSIRTVKVIADLKQVAVLADIQGPAVDARDEPGAFWQRHARVRAGESRSSRESHQKSADEDRFHRETPLFGNGRLHRYGSRCVKRCQRVLKAVGRINPDADPCWKEDSPLPSQIVDNRLRGDIVAPAKRGLNLT
jgi:hypothetical protein